MEIYRELDKVDYQSNSVITVGMFDGVHLGHQALIEKVKQKAQKTNGVSTLVTFTPHPQLVIQRIDPAAISLLSTIDEKISILNQLHLQRLIIIRFTEQFAKLDSEAFIGQILVKRIGFREIVVGHDHRFGHDKQGGLALLQKKADEYQYKVDLADVVQVDGTRVSSTSLRNLIKNGDIATANKYLGRHYSACGQVIAKKPGEGNVFELTIGGVHPQKLLPSPGTYSGKLIFGNMAYPTVIRIVIGNTTTAQRQVFVYTTSPFPELNQAVKIDFQKQLSTDVQVPKGTKINDVINLVKANKFNYTLL